MCFLAVQAGSTTVAAARRNGRRRWAFPDELPKLGLLMLDCVIIGGGPAGLTAAIYLARYRRAAVLVDDGASRARSSLRANGRDAVGDQIAQPKPSRFTETRLRG